MEESLLSLLQYRGRSPIIGSGLARPLALPTFQRTSPAFFQKSRDLTVFLRRIFSKKRQEIGKYIKN